MSKSTNIAIWTIVVFIILTTTLVLIRFSNEDDNKEEQQLITTQNTQNQENDAYTKCIDTAKNELISAETNYCLSLGNTMEYCEYNTPDLSLGKYGDIERTNEQMCQNQYPGAIYQQ